MKIFVKAKPNARETRVYKIDETHFEVRVKESPQNGKANAGVEKAIARYFRVPRSSVKVISGLTHRSKVLEVKNSDRR